MKTYPSRWGFHPCDHETYLLLKLLHARYQAALRAHARWRRWFRKKPTNRVIRQYVCDTQGRKAGHDVVGRQPEPRQCPLFGRRAEVLGHWSADGGFLPVGRPQPGFVLLPDPGIAAAYRAARTPAATPEEVRPLPLSPAAIRQLAAALAVQV